MKSCNQSRAAICWVSLAMILTVLIVNIFVGAAACNSLIKLSLHKPKSLEKNVIFSLILLKYYSQSFITSWIYLTKINNMQVFSQITLKYIGCNEIPGKKIHIVYWCILNHHWYAIVDKKKLGEVWSSSFCGWFWESMRKTAFNFIEQSIYTYKYMGIFTNKVTVKY